MKDWIGLAKLILAGSAVLAGLVWAFGGYDFAEQFLSAVIALVSLGVIVPSFSVAGGYVGAKLQGSNNGGSLAGTGVGFVLGFIIWYAVLPILFQLISL